MRQKTRQYRSMLHDYATGKSIAEIAADHNQNYQWVYQRLRLLPEFSFLRRTRRERERLWLTRLCNRCGQTRMRNEFPPSHRWCKNCRRDYYKEYHKRTRNEQKPLV